MMLNVCSIEEAYARLTSAIEVNGSRYSETCTTINAADVEEINIRDAVGRILAEPVISEIDVPGFDRSTVDGYAVIAADTFGASFSLPAMLRFDGEIMMGETTGSGLDSGMCRGISTGGALPVGSDAVVMVEDTEPIDAADDLRYIYKPVSPGQNIIFRGDDVVVGTEMLPVGTLLKPHHLGALAATGRELVQVVRRLRIALISTGDELKQPGDKLHDGQIYDVNSTMLASMLKKPGTEIYSIGVVADELELLTKTMRQVCASCDLLILSGGSSAGDRDHVAQAINQLGKPGVIQHGLAVKPGKPTLLGLADQVPIIGLPGHPVAALFMADQIVLPLIDLLSGRETLPRRTIEAVLARSLPANHGRQSFIAVKLEQSSQYPEKKVAVPAASKSGLITTLRQTDGYIIIERNCEGILAGNTVQVYLWEN